jgi:methylmalonyl-CoA/ethylmalonyl-CoA epimerase
MSEASKRGKAGVLALDHVAFGVRSIAEISHLLCVRLGAVPFQSGPGIGFNGAQWTLPGEGRVEAIEPDGGSDGFLHRFLAARGSRVHHVTFKVEDIHAAAAAVEAAGLTVVGLNTAFASWKELFLHPKEAQGIVVQLAESHPEIGDDGWTSAWPYPRSEPPGGSPRVLGLRLRSQSAERALAQWRDLLGAEAEQDDGRIRFEWPGSPLRLSVEVRPDAAEGPIALEVLATGAAQRRSARIDELDVSLVAVDR